MLTLVAAENRPDFADDARLVVVDDDQHRARRAAPRRRRRGPTRGAGCSARTRSLPPSARRRRVQLDRDQAREVPRSRASRLDDVDAARQRRGACVHDRDAARENRPQHAGRGARGEHFDAAALDESAAVADTDRLDARRAHLRRDGAELIGQPNPRLEPLQLVGVDRRKVHRVPHDAVAQEVAHRGRGLDADQFLRLFGGRRDVRRGDDLRQLGE